jgi:hypothetical protein
MNDLFSLFHIIIFITCNKQTKNETGHAECLIQMNMTFQFKLIQSVHMKCIPFYCSIAHELKGTRMKNKHI